MTDQPGRKYAVWFVRTAGWALGTTGIAKVVSSFGNSGILTIRDPVFGVKYGYLMLTVGVLELLVAAVCLSGKARIRISCALIGWMSTSFLIYRLINWWYGSTKHCPCLGGLTDSLHLSELAAERILTALVVYLLAGSLLIKLWLEARENLEIG